MVELVDYLSPEEPSDAAVVLGPALDVLWIGPHQIPKSALSGYFLLAVELAYLIEGVYVGRESSVYAEDGVCVLVCVLSTTAERGRKSKVSLKYFQTLELPYLRMISSWKP